MKTTDLITLQKSITQGEWRAVVVKTHVELGQFAPPAHYQIHGDIRGIGATLVSRLEPYGKDNNANAQAIALVPSLIAEVIRLREALDKARRGFDYTVSSMAQGHTVSISSLQNCSALCRTALENT